MNDLANEFTESAILHGKYSEEGNSEATNKEYDKIVAIAERLVSEPDHGESVLCSLIENKNAHVVVWAAKYLLPLNSALAETALQKISERDILAGLDAKMTLQEWKSELLKFDRQKHEEIFKNAMEEPPLIYWATLGNLSQVEKALNEDPNANIIDAEGYTALHGAVENNHIEVVRFLISHGAELKTNKKGITPFDIAMAQNNQEIADILK